MADVRVMGMAIYRLDSKGQGFSGLCVATENDPDEIARIEKLYNAKFVAWKRDATPGEFVPSDSTSSDPFGWGE